MDDVINRDIVDGVEVETVVQVDALEVTKTFPDVDDYKLSALLATGQPLSVVDPTFSNPYVDAENLLDASLSHDKGAESNNVEP